MNVLYRPPRLRQQDLGYEGLKEVPESPVRNDEKMGFLNQRLRWDIQ